MRDKLACLLLIVCGSAGAATITQMGTDVSFTYDDSTLYGVGTVVGNSIFFSPTNFKALSENTDGVVTTTGTINITVEVKAEKVGTYEITEFQLVELGDYLLNGSSSSVDASGRLQVSSNTKVCGLFACFDSVLYSAGALTTTGALTEWSASAGIDFGDTAGWISDTNVNAQIQNNLTAISTVNGESALIQKKGEGIGLVVNSFSVVPVPGAVWLFGSALGLLAWVRRRSA